MRTRSALRTCTASAAAGLVLVSAAAQAQQYIHSAERREQIQQLIEQHQPPDAGDVFVLNAYTLLAPLAESFRDVLDGESRNRQYVYGPEWYIPFEAISHKEDATPERVRIVLDALEALEHRGLIGVVDKMAEARRAVRPPMLTPDEPRSTTWKHRDLAITRLALEARLVHALDTQDHEAALSSFRGLLAIDRILSHQLTISDRIIGSRASSAANRRLREAIIARPLSPAVVFPALEILESQLGALPRTSEILEAERIIARDSVEHDAEVYGWKIGPDGYTREEVAEITDRILAAAQQLASVPVRDRRTDPAAIEATRVLGEIASGRDAEAEKLYVNTYTRLIEGFDEIALENAATRIMIALERHKLRHGVYPEALADLVPQELAALEGAIPMSYGLVYRRDGEAYTLYSPGYDLTNNGGTPYPDRPELALRPEGAGFDYFFRPLPRSAAAESGPEIAGPTPAEYIRALSQLVEQQQPHEAAAADANAWDILLDTIDRVNALKAAERAKGASQYLFWFDAIVYDDPKTSEEQREVASVGLDMYEESGVFEKLARIARTARAIRPSIVPEPADNWNQILYPNNDVLSEGRDLAKAAIARARGQLDAGDASGAVESLEMAMALSRITAQQVSMLHRVYASWAWQQATLRLREAATAGRLDHESLGAAAAALERQAGWTPPWQPSVTAELLWVRTLIDLSYDSRAAIPSELLEPVPLSRAESHDLATRYMTALSTLLRRSISGWGRDPDAIAAAEEMEEIRSTLPREAVLANCFIDDAYIHFHDVHALDTMATRFILAIERFKHRTGEYPESLNDLASREIPVHELGTGYYFIYRRTPEAYTLYNPGPDGIDHGGKANPENPYPWPGPDAIGFDLVYR